MTTLSFAAQVEDWVRDVKQAEEIIFKESVQEVVTQLNALVPVDTGFLRSSLQASTSAMPMLTRENPGGPDPTNAGEIVLVIAGADLGDTIYLGYTAKYGAYVAYGANGHPGRPWVQMTAQKWPTIVGAVAARVKARLGL